MKTPDRLSLLTPRLMLRPSGPGDFARAFAIRSNWEVGRNLSHAQFPPDAAHMASWFDGHAAEWTAGTAYRFAILHEDRTIGLIDVNDIDGATGELGYWLDRAAWGQGFAAEAGEAIVDFSFGSAGLTSLVAGHVADNLASARVLEKLGFTGIGEVSIFSQSRQAEIMQKRLRLDLR